MAKATTIMLCLLLAAMCSQPGYVRQGKLVEKWGYIDRKGNIVIKPQFDQVTSFSEGLAAVRIGSDRLTMGNGANAAHHLDHNWGYTDKNGRLRVPLRFAEPHPFSCGFAQVVLNDHIAFINHAGKVVVPSRYLFASDFHEERAWVGLGVHELELGPTKYAYIDLTGKTITKDTFTAASDFSEGLAAVQIRTKSGYATGYIGPDGNILIKPRFESASSFREGLAAITTRGKTGYIDRTGRIVIKPEFDGGGDFHCGLARVLYKGRYGYIDRKGTMHVKASFDEAADFSESLAKFRDTRTLKWGYIDTNGNVRIKPQYDDALGFHEGLALARAGNKWGYIDKKGKMVIPLPRSGHAFMDYDSEDQRWSFSEGLAPYPVMQSQR